MPEPSKSDKVINMHEAKSRLSQLGELAWRGGRVVISKAGKPYLELVPYRKREVRKPGRFNGKIQIADDFDQTGEDIIQLFESNEQAPRVVRQATIYVCDLYVTAIAPRERLKPWRQKRRP